MAAHSINFIMAFGEDRLLFQPSIVSRRLNQKMAGRTSSLSSQPDAWCPAKSDPHDRDVGAIY
jgi:hypothetical protein